MEHKDKKIINTRSVIHVVIEYNINRTKKNTNFSIDLNSVSRHCMYILIFVISIIPNNNFPK